MADAGCSAPRKYQTRPAVNRTCSKLQRGAGAVASMFMGIFIASKPLPAVRSLRTALSNGSGKGSSRGNVDTVSNKDALRKLPLSLGWQPPGHGQCRAHTCAVELPTLLPRCAGGGKKHLQDYITSFMSK